MKSKLKDEPNPWTKIDVRTVYDNPWIHVEEHQVLDPKGNPTIYGVVHAKNLAVGILPLDKDNYTWLVGQFRFPLDRYSWEIVEGGGKQGVEPIESAKRELKEETGIIANDWQHLITIHTSNCIADETAIIFVARDLTFGESEPDDNEQLQVAKVHFDDVYQMVLDGEITDSMSVAAIFKAKLMMQEGLL